MTCTNPATWNENSRGVGGLKLKCPPWGGDGYFLGTTHLLKKKHVGEKSIANFTLKLLLFED